MRRLLGFICLAMVAIIVWQWRAWPPLHGGLPTISAEADGETRPAQQPETRLSLMPPLHKEEYVSVTERPLFLSSRRPPEEEAPAEATAPEVPVVETPLENLDLNAVIITPAGAIAWVKTPSQPKPQKVQVGDELEGWKVKSISSDEVEMEGQRGLDRLVLRNFSQNEQPGPKQRGQAERRNQSTPRGSPTPVTTKEQGQKPPPAGSKSKPAPPPRPNPSQNAK